MVSMLPNTQRYDLTYQWTKPPCVKPKYAEINNNTIYDLIKNNKRFSKTFKLIEKARLRDLLADYSNPIGYTFFITEDKNIPDSFMEKADLFMAETLLNSYLVNGVAHKELLLSNGNSIYNPRRYKQENPILAIVPEGTSDIYINKVGKIVEEFTAVNGVIHVMDNIAQVSYIN
jgi:uncharacterized surface protein with fasciclin (FAS1) repeats